MPDIQGLLNEVYDPVNKALRISGSGAEIQFVGAGGLELIAGARTLVVTNDVTRLAMADAATTTFGCTMILPPFWTTAQFGFYYVTSVTAAGNIRWRQAVKKHAIFQDNISEAFLADVSATIDAPDLGIVTNTAGAPLLNGINVAPDTFGSIFSVVTSRLGADALDTYTGVAELMGVYAIGS
jgi:hypothetical protein